MAAAESTAPRSGSRAASIGVETHTMMASTSANPSSSGERSVEPAAKRVAEALVGNVVDRRASGSELGQARLVGVVADDLQPSVHECDAQGQADVAKSDDRDAAVHGRQIIRPA